MSDIKKAKVKSRAFVGDREHQGRKYYNFDVVFEGSDKVFKYSSSKQEPPYFKPGEEQEFTYEHLTGEKDGKAWEIHKVKPHVEKPAYGGGKGYVFNADNERLKKKMDIVAYGTAYAKDLYAVNREEWKDDVGKTITATAEVLIEYMWGKIDQVK